MNNATHTTEVLSFTHGDNLATVVTDGLRHMSYELEMRVQHPTLTRAIAYLESKGYELTTDDWDSIK